MKAYLPLAIVLGLLCIVFPVSATIPATLYVSNDANITDYTTIQSAVDAASSGDTIYVLPGTYSRFEVGKPHLTIQALPGDELVILDCNGGEGPRVPSDSSQDATGTILDGFTFVNPGSVIKLGNYGPASDSIIRNCMIIGMTDRMSPKGSNITFENNTIIDAIGNEFGAPAFILRLRDATDCNIINNTFINVTSTEGIITLRDTTTTNNTIAGNTFDSTCNGNAFYFRDAGENNRIHQNNNVSGVALHAGTTAPVNISWNTTAPVTYTYDGVEHTDFVGNFWSSYAASDADGDGILDTPHVLPSGLGTDHAPLAGAWEDGVIASPAPEPKTWYVGEGGDYAAIQAAVDAAAAGDTIVVKDGAYTENVLVDRALTLMTENGPASVTVTAAVPAKPVFDLRADGIAVRGFTTRGPTNEHVASIESVGYDDCLIIGNDCGGGCYNGIHLGGNATNCTITENSCHGNTKRGISLRDDACGNFVYNNTCTGNADQICAKDNVHDNYIWANTFVGSVQCLGEDICHSPEEVAYTYNGVGYTGYVGNYYSGYTGIDADGNGIGDTPVFIGHDKYTNTDRYDNYPIMGPWTGPWRNGTIVFVEPAPATPSDVTITSPAPGSTHEIGLPVQFAATAVGANLTYTWETGDGGNATGQDVTYTYGRAGTYTVNLTVSNEHGSSSAEIGIVITKPEPIVFNTSVTVYADEPIVVDGVSYGGNTFFNILAAAGYVYTYADSDAGYSDRKPLLTLTMDGVTYPTRNFGDDYKWKFYETLGTGDDKKFKKALNGYITGSGAYYIWYGDLSQFGWWDLPSVENSTYVVELNVTLLPTRPSGDGTPSGVTIISPLSNSSYAVGAPVHLAATATGDNLTYTWDLGNGDTVTGKTTDYTYTTAGNYTITLTVANDVGSAEASTGITIVDSDLPYIVLYQGTVDIVDGSTIMAAISPRSGGYTPGEDYIEIPATSVGGMLNASGFIFDLWKSSKPIPTYSLTDITTPEGVCYPNVQNATADLAWRSFDGMTSAATKYDPNVVLANGTTIYTVYGDYNVVNSDPSGARYVIVTTLNIVDSEPADAPVAGFDASTTSGDAPLAVQFTDRSTNTPTSWSWTFGDGASSAEQDPEHVYTAPGTYTVALTVANAAGNDSVAKTIAVTEAAEGETDTIVLQRGWNFVSTPKRLADGANTYAIFNDVDTAAHTILLYDGLEYDWKMMGPADTFRPLDAVWIYANGTYEIPLAFASGAPDLPPTKDLGKGWNAIGFSGTEPLSAATSLLSLGDRWATLIGYDAVDQRYEAGIIRTSASETRRMQPTQGYWIYMTRPDTLAAISG
ncbi:MAG TPA: PKD domain-containing protein [Methanoculleus sp.]|nr:PKD domain-containing protein [Methanoculleus sp.]